MRPITWEQSFDTLRDNVMIAGIDCDGILRGKFVPKSKCKGQKLPFCSVIYGWDCNDAKYTKELAISNADSGYADLVAELDPERVFKYPGQLDSSLVLCHFFNESNKPIDVDPRTLLRKVMARHTEFIGMAGAEIEFYNYAESSNSASGKSFSQLKPLTQGMHGYSVLRPSQNSGYWKDILEFCAQFGIDFDTFHSETGPGVYECAIKYCNVEKVADQVTLFKLATRLASNDTIIPCFMAKPQTNMPGNSGHLHCSLYDRGGVNLFSFDSQESKDKCTNAASLPLEAQNLTPLGRSFLAGLLDGLKDVMLMFAPNLNSYKRLDPEFWAPTAVCWGAENRLASIRVIDMYPGSKSCRFEVRIPGADLIPHYALAAIYGLGLRGIEKGLELTTKPVASLADIRNSPQLPISLPDAIRAFKKDTSIARELFGNDFVDHYAGTREHEFAVSQRNITDWEVQRYLETC